MYEDFFLHPKDPMQKRYEALRASFVDKLSAKEVAKKLGYSVHTINALRRDFKSGKLESFFKDLKRGPKEARSNTLKAKERIIELRKQNYSVEEIEEALLREGIVIAFKTIHKVLEAEGFVKLFRRTEAERLIALQMAKNRAEETDVEKFAQHTFVRTSYGGIFLFIPLILELKLHTLFYRSEFYGSKRIPKINYLMSFIVLKLIGIGRLSHIIDLNFDYGLGSFAGLNVLPKTTAITQYSYRNSNRLVINILKEWNHILEEKGYIQGQHINLDFHSIPHWGEESQLDNNWVPTRRKAMKSILSFFAQDLDTTYLCYSNAYLTRDEASEEILNFVSFYKKSHGRYPQCLVFDSKLTTYKNLDIIGNDLKIQFITIRKRGKNILKKIENNNNWTSVKLDIKNRKYKKLRVYEEKVTVNNYEGNLRQIIVTGNGRNLPMLIITNDMDTKVKDIIETYAHRWLIENNIQENIDFFNLNALSSPVIVKVNFDIAITLIANTLYKILSSKFKLFVKAKPKTVYRNFVEGGAKIYITDEKVKVHFSKKAFNPVIMDWVYSLPELRVPLMGNRILEYSFE